MARAELGGHRWDSFGPLALGLLYHHCRNRATGCRLELAGGLSANSFGFERSDADFSRRRADARGRRRLPRAALIAPGSLGMSGFVHSVLDQADRPNPSNCRLAL